jgi:hypothetical protein
MRKIQFGFLFFVLLTGYYSACEACKLQQPKITQKFTHGTGPQSGAEWVIVGIIILTTLFTLFYSLKYLIKPGEANSKHIKNSVLDF